MSQQITLVVKAHDGQVQKMVLKPGARVAAGANQQYQILLDGREQWPEGTRVEKVGQDLRVQFANGETVTLTDWSAVDGASLEAAGTGFYNSSVEAFADAAQSGQGGADAGAAAGAGSGTAAGAGSAGGGTAAAGGAAGSGISATTIVLGAGLLAGIAGFASSGGGSRKPPAVPSGVTLAPASDSGALGDGLTNDNTPTLTGRGDPASTIEVRNGTTVVATAVVDSAGNWSATPTTALADGAVTLTVVANSGSGTPASEPASINLTIDTAAPAVGVAPDMTAATDSGSSNTDNITSNARPAFTIAAPGAGNTAALYVDGSKVAATFDATANTLTPTAALVAGSRAISYTLTDTAGNESARSAALAAVIDNTAPGTPTAVAPEGPLVNTVENSDGVQVNVTAGTGGFAAGETVTVNVARPDGSNTTVARAVTAGEVTAGVAVIVVPPQTVQGAYSLTASVTDLAGNASAPSAAHTFTLDTVAPPAPTIAIAEAADGLINDPEAISGGGSSVVVTLANGAAAGNVLALTVTNPGAPVVISYTLTATDITNGSVALLIPTANLTADGSYSARATLTDPAGNASVASNAVAFTVDRSAAAPSAPDMTAATDLGVSNTDNLTSSATPVFTGTGAESGATVSLYDTDGTTVLGTAVAAVGGGWTITASALAAGDHTLTAKQADLAGNISPASASLKVTIDASAPTFGTKLAAVEDFTSVDVSGASLGAADNLSKQASLVVTSAAFKSATGFVSGDVSIAIAGGKATVTALGGAANKSGSIVLSVGVQDEAGNLTTQDVTVSVASVNDAPAGVDATVTMTEDTAYTFGVGDFSFTDAADSPANLLQSVIITTLPALGGLKLNGVNVTAGQEVLASDIAANKLVYTPVADGAGTGYSSLTFQVRDDGGTTNGGVNLDATANKLTINVTSVNDAPVLDASKAIAFSSAEYAFSGGPDASLSAPTGATPAGSVSVGTLVDFATPAGQVDNVTDADTGAKLGIGVTSLSTNAGSTLWYTTDTGTTWEWISNTGGSKVATGLYGADGKAAGGDDVTLLLADTARVLFDGGASAGAGNIADAFSVRAWDQTSGTNGGSVVAAATGAANSLSTVTDTVQVNFTSNVIDLSRLSATAGVQITGGTATSQFGFDLSTAGDVNGDGFDDFIVTQYGNGAGANSGATLIYGQAGTYGSVGGDGTRTAAVGSLATDDFGRPGFFFTGASKIGDVNNDGYADFMLASDPFGATGSGNAWVVFGKAGGVGDIPLLGLPSKGGGWFQISQSFYGLGEQPHTISWAGDVNGDGYDDMLMAMRIAPAAGPGTFGSGLAVVLYGHAGNNFGTGNNLDLTPFAVDPATLSDTGGAAGHILDAGTDTRGMIIGAGVAGNGLQWARSAAGLGDRNGDGYGDFAFNVDLGGTGANAILMHGKLTADDGGNVLWFAGPPGPNWVGHGSTQGATNNARIRIEGNGAGQPNQNEPDRITTKGIGDVNGDGFDDFAMAYNGVNNGEVYVIYGSTTVLADNDTIPLSTVAAGFNGFKITGLGAGDKLGESVRAAGDINGDGFDDFIIGAPNNDVGGASNQGAAYIIYGGVDTGANDISLATGLASNRGITIRGETTGDNAGYAVAGAGDVNGDGLADVLVSARSNDQGATDAGSVYLIYGSTAYGNASAQVGAAVSTSTANQSLVGTTGADVLTALAAGASISGGAGNDRIVVTATDWRNVDGGAGFDTLAIDRNTDFTSIGTGARQNLSGRTNSIEQLDLGVGANTVTVTLAEQDVYQMAGDFAVPAGGSLSGRQHNALFVLGDSGDTVTFAEGVGSAAGGWTSSGAVVTNPIGDAASYVLYTRGTAQVYVAAGVAVTDVVVGTSGDDVIAGGPTSQMIFGAAGIDVIRGAGGNDTLYGGALGSTAGTSEAGVKDIFAYSLTTNTASGNDAIKDFQVGVDRLYLTDTVDTNTAIGGIEISDITQATSASQYVTFGTDGAGNVRLTITTGTGVSTVVLEGVAYEASATAANGAYGSLAELMGAGETQLLFLTGTAFGAGLATLP